MLLKLSTPARVKRNVGHYYKTANTKSKVCFSSPSFQSSCNVPYLRELEVPTGDQATKFVES
jgi:hypothetical protein